MFGSTDHVVLGLADPACCVRRDRSSSIRLLKSGDRCCRTTKAMPVSVGRRREQPLERLESAGGRADADDMEILTHWR